MEITTEVISDDADDDDRCTINIRVDHTTHTLNVSVYTAKVLIGKWKYLKDEDTVTDNLKRYLSFKKFDHISNHFVGTVSQVVTGLSEHMVNETKK